MSWSSSEEEEKAKRKEKVGSHRLEKSFRCSRGKFVTPTSFRTSCWAPLTPREPIPSTPTFSFQHQQPCCSNEPSFLPLEPPPWLTAALLPSVINSLPSISTWAFLRNRTIWPISPRTSPLFSWVYRVLLPPPDPPNRSLSIWSNKTRSERRGSMRLSCIVSMMPLSCRLGPRIRKLVWYVHAYERESCDHTPR